MEPLSPSGHVVESVARKEGVSPSRLTQPLYDSVDPDALDALFVRQSGPLRVTFEYMGYDVTVTKRDGTPVSVDVK